jgi:ADP-ribose pyrophosphatase
VFTEVVHLFLARELTPTSAQLEPGEILELKWLPLSSAMREALDGTVEDAKTVIALVRAASRLGIAPDA